MDNDNQAEPSTSSSIKRIWAWGTKGKAAKVQFEARKNKEGNFVLNNRYEKDSKVEGRNQAVNKHCVGTFERFWNCLKQVSTSLIYQAANRDFHGACESLRI